jgi:hypothetical protein
MSRTTFTCPNCGATNPGGRRCRKCGTPLNELSSPPSDVHQHQSEHPEQTRLRVSLVSTPLPTDQSEGERVGGDPLLAQLHTPRQYCLEIVDPVDRALDKTIPVPGTAGMRLARWKIATIQTGKVLSAYFYINSAGHDLDTWIHFDLETGQVLGMNPGDESDPDPYAHRDMKRAER